MGKADLELGQMMFSNAKVGYWEVPEIVEAVLRTIADEIERVEWNNTQKHYEAPTGNNGGEYKTDKFKMRAYCWCDGERHKKGCPANFEWRDVKITWYKYLGRGMTTNTEFTPDLANAMLEDCLASVRATEKDLLGEAAPNQSKHQKET
jgi:hypothetical protein